MSFLIVLAALCFLMFVAYRGYSVILFAPIAALGAVLLTDPSLVAPMFTGLFMDKMVGFLKLYFPVFVLGAVFGKLIEISGFSKAIVAATIKVVGAQRAMPGQMVGLSANGQRDTNQNITLDGVTATDDFKAAMMFVPSIEAIQEFKVQSAVYSAEYGMNSGSQANVAIRSGTNELHGAAFHFLRNNAFDARGFFLQPDQPQNKLRRNQFGGVLSGPLVRNIQLAGSSPCAGPYSRITSGVSCAGSVVMVTNCTSSRIGVWLTISWSLAIRSTCSGHTSGQLV